MKLYHKACLLIGLGTAFICSALGFGGYYKMNKEMRNSNLVDRAEIVQMYRLISDNQSKISFLVYPIYFGNQLAVENYQTSPCEKAVESELEEFIDTCYNRTSENLHDGTLARIVRKRDQKLAAANLPSDLNWRCDTFGYKPSRFEDSAYGVDLKVLKKCQ